MNEVTVTENAWAEIATLKEQASAHLANREPHKAKRLADDAEKIRATKL